MYTEDKRYVCYCAIALLVLFSPEVAGQVAEHTRAENIISSTTTEEFGFWYRTIVAALLGVLVWIARGADVRLRTVEKEIGEFHKLAVERGAKLDMTSRRLELLDHEHKNTISLILAQRELLLTKYHDKEDTDRHRDKIERLLDDNTKALQHISQRLDHMVRPTHRASDDIHGHHDHDEERRR